MKKLYRWMVECAASHQENGDDIGAQAILFALKNGVKQAKAAFPDSVDAITNAVAYAKQELNGGIYAA